MRERPPTPSPPAPPPAWPRCAASRRPGRPGGTAGPRRSAASIARASVAAMRIRPLPRHRRAHLGPQQVHEALQQRRGQQRARPDDRVMSHAAGGHRHHRRRARRHRVHQRGERLEQLLAHAALQLAPTSSRQKSYSVARSAACACTRPSASGASSRPSIAGPRPPPASAASPRPRATRPPRARTHPPAAAAVPQRVVHRRGAAPRAARGPVKDSRTLRLTNVSAVASPRNGRRTSRWKVLRASSSSRNASTSTSAGTARSAALRTNAQQVVAQPLPQPLRLARRARRAPCATAPTPRAHPPARPPAARALSSRACSASPSSAPSGGRPSSGSVASGFSPASTSGWCGAR